MKYRNLLLVALILCFSYICVGQPPMGGDDPKEPNAVTKSGDPTTEEGNVPKTAGKIVIPPVKTKPITVPKIDESDPIVIDGILNEPIWQSAAKFRDFYQTYPGDNIEPSKPTEVYMVYDEKNLYVAFKCWDDKEKIRATVAKRDSVFGEDNVRMWLDTYDDQRRAYILGFNPLGIQADGIFIEGQGSDFSVDIVMESKGAIYDWGWAVEVKIPFKSLRYSAGKDKHWGFNVARNIDRFNDEFDSWMPDDRNVSGFLIKHGRITGFDGIKSERTLEIIPSVTFSETGKRIPDAAIPEGRLLNEPIKYDVGVTFKYSITPNITLDAAINPDFAEIEADAPIVSANRRFPVFFPEKRPFFLEGADVFNSPLRLFNSRSIVDPDIAAKLTGKVGKNSFGLLVATDNAPGNYGENDRNDPNFRPFIDEFVDKNALFAVLRLKRDIGKENNIGVFMTARTFPENKNFAGGFDGRIKMDKSTVFSFQAVATHSRRCFFESTFDPDDNPDQAFRNGVVCGGGIVNGEQQLGDQFSRYRTGNGFGYYANLDHTKDKFGYVLEMGGRSSDYRAESGFTQRTDSHFLFGGFRKSSKSNPKAKIIRVNWFNGVNYGYDGKGRTQEGEYNSNVSLNFQKNTFINFFGGMGHSRIYEDEFGLTRNDNRDGAFFGEDVRSATFQWLGSFFRTGPSKKWSWWAEFVHSWNAFDFDFGAGPRFPRVSPGAMSGDGRLDPGTGKRINFATGVDLSPTDPLSISFRYNKARLVRDDTGGTAFDTNIFSLRSTYQFTRFVFARIRADYDTLQANMRGQYLFGWTPSPGKAFYIGYNDDLNINGHNPYTGLQESGFSRNNRKFFIRMSYLFRKSF